MIWQKDCHARWRKLETIFRVQFILRQKDSPTTTKSDPLDLGDTFTRDKLPKQTRVGKSHLKTLRRRSIFNSHGLLKGTPPTGEVFFLFKLKQFGRCFIWWYLVAFAVLLDFPRQHIILLNYAKTEIWNFHFAIISMSISYFLKIAFRISDWEFKYFVN